MNGPTSRCLSEDAVVCPKMPRVKTGRHPVRTAPVAPRAENKSFLVFNMGPGGEGWGPAFLFVSLYINMHPDPDSGNRGRHLRTPPTQLGGSAGAGLRRTAAPTSERGSNLCGLRTRTRRGGDDGGARRVETRWRGAARGDNGAIVASPGSARTPSHIALQCADASLPPCPSGRRWRRRRHQTCVHRRARWRAPPWGTQRRTRHRRITTVSSTSGGFHRRRRRRRLRGRHAEGRGTTFGADCAAQRAASAPSPPHVHSTRARSAPSCCGHELARV